MDKKIMTFTGELIDDGVNNSTFKRVKVRIFAFDKNANGSDITKVAFENAKNSLKLVPMVAKYNSKDDDLEGHNIVLTKDKNGNYVIKMDTTPFGCVGENPNIIFEDVEENGIIKTYVVVDNVYLWKRYEATQKIIEWFESGITPKVSMEIGSVSGEFSDGYFIINSFEFEAITALGLDVSPCFPNADIQEYSLKFEKKYKEMIKELRFSLLSQSSNQDVDNINTKKGGSDVGIDEILAKYNLTQEQLDFSIDGLSVEELEIKLQEFTAKNTEGEVATEFTLSAEQFREELINVLSVEQVQTEWDGWTYNRYSYVDYKDGVVFAFDNKENCKLYGFNFTVSGDGVNIDFDSKKRKKFEIVDFEEGSVATEFELFPKDVIDYSVKVKEKELEVKFTADKESAVKEIQAQLNDINSKYSILEEETNGLKEFKSNKLIEERNEQETEIFERYSMLNGVEEFENIKENAKTFSIADLEKEIALCYVKKNATFSKQPEKKFAKIGMDKEDTVKVEPYGDLFKKHLNK